MRGSTGMGQSVDFKYQKEFAIQKIRNILEQNSFPIKQEKIINNGYGYKISGDEYSIIVYFKGEISSKIVFEKETPKLVECFGEEKETHGIPQKTIQIHTSIKIDSEEKIEKIKNAIINHFEDYSLFETNSTQFYRIQLQNKNEKFTITQYKTGTLLLQGQSSLLFTEVLGIIKSINPLSNIENSMLYVPKENKNEVQKAMLASADEFKEIRLLAEERISKPAFSFLYKNDQDTLISAIGILKVVKENNLNIPLYNPILYPFAKVFEGFVIKLLIEKEFFTFDAYKSNPDIADIGNALRKKKLEKYIRDVRRNGFVSDKLATTWESIRCHELHSDPAQNDSIINLADINQVENRIGEIAGTIIDAYRIIVENGFSEEEMKSNKKASIAEEK